jgi:hypothetical protein
VGGFFCFFFLKNEITHKYIFIKLVEYKINKVYEFYMIKSNTV